jgi:hypothetical protein
MIHHGCRRWFDSQSWRYCARRTPPVGGDPSAIWACERARQRPPRCIYCFILADRAVLRPFAHLAVVVGPAARAERQVSQVTGPARCPLGNLIHPSPSVCQAMGSIVKNSLDSYSDIDCAIANTINSSNDQIRSCGAPDARASERLGTWHPRASL